DIGKNLVDIILTNNGYKVVNLGIKQPIATIVSEAKEHKAQAIGMSGLLVKSTVVMKDNLEELTREGIDIPVFLGGAALTRNYVEEDCVRTYASGRVAYARDAFDGLALMDRVVTGKFDEYLEGVARKRLGKPSNQNRKIGRAVSPAGSVDPEVAREKRNRLADGVEVPEPPFWGPRVIARVPLKTLVPYLNERMLYQLQWGYRKEGRRLDDYMVWAQRELRPVLKRMVDLSEDQDILVPQAVYGYWKAAASGDDLILYGEDGEREVGRFTLPRQAKAQNGEKAGTCITDFVRDVDAGERDVIGLQVVTMGQRASEVARDWFAGDRYQDYLYLHGLSVEMTEAMAEYVHKRIRAELGFAAEDDRDMEKMLQQGYRGSRYSFGYPACPNLEDQEQLLGLLNAGQIGVELSDEHQLHPEQSTSALVIHHPKAKYFGV
ncbi:MAG TPA: vitamin B12 dependent-methionine synthase activation domain-containing protein, partial [Alphaproteobacteria bacterium]|nr:vitamin B12 dependent-methionine synthase activation domain-containing protein [Alphaproteobacteria bacterium]